MTASLALGPTVGALVGLALSILLVPLGINKAEWLMTTGTALGLFVGLLILAEQQRQPPSNTRAEHKT
ncbi:MAG: hypothetical protein NZ578_07590 [Candidatus Binatia bacterium]|nr:hypothetical protein [Candidatus Binatia bacterium]